MDTTVPIYEIWGLALFGWIGYNLIVFYIEKNEADDQDREFDYTHFAKTHWDNWLVTLFFAAPIVYYGPEIHSAIMGTFNMEMEWHEIFYAGPGVFVEGLVWGLKTLRKKLKID